MSWETDLHHQKWITGTDSLPWGQILGESQNGVCVLRQVHGEAG